MRQLLKPRKLGYPIAARVDRFHAREGRHAVPPVSARQSTAGSLLHEVTYRRTGRREQSREHRTTATTIYREMDMRFWLEQAEAELMELGA